MGGSLGLDCGGLWVGIWEGLWVCPWVGIRAGVWIHLSCRGGGPWFGLGEFLVQSRGLWWVPGSRACRVPVPLPARQASAVPWVMPETPCPAESRAAPLGRPAPAPPSLQPCRTLSSDTGWHHGGGEAGTQLPPKLEQRGLVPWAGTEKRWELGRQPAPGHSAASGGRLSLALPPGSGRGCLGPALPSRELPPRLGVKETSSVLCPSVTVVTLLTCIWGFQIPRCVGKADPALNIAPGRSRGIAPPPTLKSSGATRARRDPPQKNSPRPGPPLPLSQVNARTTPSPPPASPSLSGPQNSVLGRCTPKTPPPGHPQICPPRG